MRADTITLSIEEKFSTEEMTEIAQKLVAAQTSMEEQEAEKKISDSHYNERIKGFAAEVSAFAKQYSKGSELAQIGCDIRYDNPEPGQKSYVRMDTGETVQTHPMSWEEKQETIQFPLTPALQADGTPQPTDTEVNEAIAGLRILPDAEVTKLCDKTPGCGLFAEHDGGCVVEKSVEDSENQTGAA
jgi:hypothetical protein